MQYNHYNSRLRITAQKLRNESVSLAEKVLWRKVLGRNQTGHSFKRQRPIDSFMVDFFCPRVGLIIEIDGNSHFHKSIEDSYRQNRLEELGYKLLRLSEEEVLRDIDGVTMKILHALDCLPEYLPLAPSKG
jgi:very-short-patch-repair endonuclease